MSQPNILWITSDQQHWSTLGALNPNIRTPSLDGLAREGTLFTRAYCPNPTCTPTRASMITGLYPSRHGAYSLGTCLPEDVPTVGDVFHDAGYATGLIGKAHFQPLHGTAEFPSLESYPILQDLDFWREFRDPFYGFRHVELARNHGDEAHAGQHYAIWMEEKGCPDWRRFFQPPTGTTPAQYGRWNIPEELHYNTWIVERTEAFLERSAKANKPFFLWSSFFDPHPPYVVPAPWDTMYRPEEMEVPELVPGEHDRNPPHFRMTQQAAADFSQWQCPGGKGLHGMHSHLRSREDRARDMALYYGMTSCMDAAIGRILQNLERLGLAGNTLVVFTSDHGHLFGQHGMTVKGPFHYEDLLKVPFIVRWPGRVAAGRQCDALQSLVDLPQTCLAAAGLEPMRGVSGVDQCPVWRGEEKSKRQRILVENCHQPPTLDLRTVVTDRYKLTTYRGQSYGEIFDLKEDPQENNCLWNDRASADLKGTLFQELSTAMMEAASMPMPRIANA